MLECEPKHVGALKERLKLEDRDNNLKRHAAVHRIQLQNIQDGGKTYAARLKALQPPTVAEMLAEGLAIDMAKGPGADNSMRATYLASRALMQEPNNAQAHLLRARARANLGIGPLSALAWSHATRALQIDPNLAVRAVLFVRGKGFSEAAAELTAAIAIDPSDMRFYAQRGDAYAQLGRNREAVQDLTHFLASSPNDLLALQARALAHYGLKNHQAALNNLDAAFKVDPKNFNVRASTVMVLDAMSPGDEADAVHIVLMVDHEAAHAYLSGRMTPALAAKAATVKDGMAFAAKQKRAQDRFQAFVDEYSPGEYIYEDLVGMMSRANSSANGEKTLKDLRDTANSADARLKAAWRLGNALTDSDDIQGLPEELVGKLATYSVHVETMQAGLANIMDALQ